MYTHWLTSATRYLWRSLAESAREVQVLRERLKTIEDIQEARGKALLREWLSPELKAQFDASKGFDVVGCDSGRRYRISHGKGTNVHEIDDAGRPAGHGLVFCPIGAPGRRRRHACSKNCFRNKRARRIGGGQQICRSGSWPTPVLPKRPY
jgi:hypothetical protein